VRPRPTKAGNCLPRIIGLGSRCRWSGMRLLRWMLRLRRLCLRPRSGARCAVPECRGISHADATFREALWDRFFTAAPRPRKRHFEPEKFEDQSGGQSRSFDDVGSMSGLPPKAAVKRTSVDVAKVPILLQKSPSRLRDIEICNYRIGAPALLNRCCVLQPDLESIFLAETLKILLQHNLPAADETHTPRMNH
jgi:hypothetical protein